MQDSWTCSKSVSHYWCTLILLRPLVCQSWQRFHICGLAALLDNRLVGNRGWVGSDTSNSSLNSLSWYSCADPELAIERDPSPLTAQSIHYTALNYLYQNLIFATLFYARFILCARNTASRFQVLKIPKFHFYPKNLFPFFSLKKCCTTFLTKKENIRK